MTPSVCGRTVTFLGCRHGWTGRFGRHVTFSVTSEVKRKDTGYPRTSVFRLSTTGPSSSSGTLSTLDRCVEAKRGKGGPTSPVWTLSVRGGVSVTGESRRRGSGRGSECKKSGESGLGVRRQWGNEIPDDRRPLETTTDSTSEAKTNFPFLTRG